MIEETNPMERRAEVKERKAGNKEREGNHEAC